MHSPLFLSVSDQVAAFLRAEIARGRWRGLLPGKNQLAEEIGVNAKTVEAALYELEEAGVLLGRGPGRRRAIVEQEQPARPLCLGFLLHDPTDLTSPLLVDFRHELTRLGHLVLVPEKTQSGMGMDLERIQRQVTSVEADAWIVVAGSRPVLEWFSQQPKPTFALFGHRSGLPIAAVGPDKAPAMIEATRHLVQLGHRRIALICRRLRRLPNPGSGETAFLEELSRHGIPSGMFNLPDWEETPAGFTALMESMFRVTPPTALIVDEAPWYIAAMHYLARRGLRVPAEVSLVSTDGDPGFVFCDPPVSCIHWESRPVLRRLLQWTSRVARHRTDIQQTLTRCVFRRGGTCGPCATRG